MISLDKAVIARYQHGQLNFEILVEPENAYRAKKGEEIPLDNLVASRDVFSDSKKGLRASESDLNKTFGTNNFETILKKVMKGGEIQLTTEQKKKMQEEKTKQIVNMIAKNAVDPRTHAPHPPNRIEKALEEARIHVDPFKPAQDQIEGALKAIKFILPIKLEIVRIAVKIPAENAVRVYGFVKEHKMMKEEWESDGSLIAVVEIPAGLQGEFFDKLNKLTSGNNETKIIERI
jgi:ribosome maturation protein SDO1